MVRPLLHPVLYEPRTTKVWYQPLLDLKPYAGLVAQDEYIGVGAHGLAPWDEEAYGQAIAELRLLDTQISNIGFYGASGRRGPVFDGRKINLTKPAIDNSPYLNTGLYFAAAYQNYIQQTMWYPRKFSLYIKLENIQSGGQIFGGQNNVGVPSFRINYGLGPERFSFEIGDTADPFARISITFYPTNPWQGFLVAVVDEDTVTFYIDDEVQVYNLEINKHHSRRYVQVSTQTWIIGHDINGSNAVGGDLYAAAMFNKRLTAQDVDKLKTIDSPNEVRQKVTPFDEFIPTYPRLFAWLGENNIHNDQPYSLIPAPWVATNNAWMINVTIARNPTIQTTGSLKFDGVDDRLYLSNFGAVAPERTMILRVMNLDGGTVLSTGSASEQFYFRFPNTDTVEFHYTHATEGTGFLSGPAIDGQFNVVAVTIEATTMRLYVNGAEVDSVVGTSWHFNATTMRTTLGARYNGASIGLETDYFEGIVSHLVIVDDDAMTSGDVSAVGALTIPELAPISAPVLPASVSHAYDVLNIGGLSEGDFATIIPDDVNGFDLEAIHGVDDDIYKPIYRENAGDYGYPALEFWGPDNRLVRAGFQGSDVAGESFTLMMLWRMVTPDNVDCRYWSKLNPNVAGSPTIVRNSSVYYETYPFPGWLNLNYARPYEEDVHVQTLFSSKVDATIYFSINFDRFKALGQNPFNGFPDDSDLIGIGKLGGFGSSPKAYFYGAWLIPGELTEQQYQDMRTYIKARFPKLFEGNVYV